MYVIQKSPITITETDTPNDFPEMNHSDTEGYRKMPADWTPPTTPTKYLKWNTGETDVIEMTQAEKDEVDATALASAKTAKIVEMSQSATDTIDASYHPYKQRNGALDIYDAETKTAIQTTISTNRTKYYSKVDLINACTTVEAVQEITWE